ncbi:MAG: sugar phosphate isomerase/epimerase [Tannerellaceae bacterium]|jgi:sugar phosphate isomerase/epimerase|nr:sugar phosphate isomerase/epimerase [Tannerellaceae bacterium]
MDNTKNFSQTRRAFLGTSAALAGMTILPLGVSSCKPAAPVAPADGKPLSNFGGVQIGAITYSWRDQPAGLENIIKYCVESGINSVELMSGDLEDYLGAPKNPMQDAIRQWMQQQRAAAPPPAPSPATGAAPAAQRPRIQLPPELQAGVDSYNEAIKAWRLSVDMNKVASARQLLADAGIEAHIVKFSPGNWEDDLIDYAFKVAKAMGAKGVTDEIGEEAVKKMAPVAERNGMYAIFHNHMQFAEPSFGYDPFIAVSEAVRFNFDMGHFFGSTGIHPNEIIRKYHDRIFSLHIKDKTGPSAKEPNANQVWGQGETPLADVLLLLKQEQWPIYCDIELEYPVAPWSTSVKEVRTCVQYARNILI